MNKIKLNPIIGLVSSCVVFIMSLIFVIKCIDMYEIAYMFFPMMAMYMVVGFVAFFGIIISIKRIREERKNKNN